MSALEESERPTKRQRLESNERATNIQFDTTSESQKSHIPGRFDKMASDAALAAQAIKEVEVGIADFVNEKSPGFRGILKKRYTDFLVNEILPNGKVAHLENLKAPRTGRGGVDGATHQEVKPEAGEQSNGHNSGLELVKDEKPDLSAELPQASASEEFPATECKQNASGEVSADVVSAEDEALLTSYFNEKATEELITLYNKILASPNIKPKEHGTVRTDFTSDRSVRGKIHESIRRIFNHRIDSSTDNEGILVLSAAIPTFRRPGNQLGRGGSRGGAWGDRRAGKPSWTDRGGEYLHFSLFKENKDTMEVVSILSRQLKTNAKAFQFAGTKDRRAVTVQRVSAFRLDVERVAGMNRMLWGSQVGDFEYQTRGLELGDLKGNEFVITLRDCRFHPFDGANSPLSMADKLAEAQTIVSSAITSLHQNGFTNYYGLQRFGTFMTRTDTIGLKLLQENFAGACDDILAFSPNALAAAQNPTVEPAEPIGKDDKARAEAIHNFQSDGYAGPALDKLPRKFSAESNIIRHLGRNRKDHYGALMMIPRNLRLMYVHAYQSFVWNHAAGERWRAHGKQVVAGDLVLINEHKEKVAGGTVPDFVDADGEVVIQPGGEDRSNTADDIFERARALTVEEAQSGKYDVFDVVLPLPGYDILYPQNEIGKFYETFMESERGGKLNPYDMRRKHRDFSLSGSYRKVMARIDKDYCVELKSYSGDDEQFVQTDLEKIKRQGGSINGHEGLKPREELSGEGDKLAVIIKLQLGSSQYATMALRELMKGGVEAWKPDFGGRG